MSKRFDEMELRICTKCGEAKPATAEYFFRHKGHRAGLESRCKVCSSAATTKWRRENPEKIIAATAKWEKENSEKARESRAKWRKENPEKVRELRAKWRKENPEKVREANAKWKKENPEMVREIDERQREKLLDCYVKATIRKVYDISTSEIDQGFIEDKREQLQNHRELKQLLKTKQNG